MGWHPLPITEAKGLDPFLSNHVRTDTGIPTVRTQSTGRLLSRLWISSDPRVAACLFQTVPSLVSFPYYRRPHSGEVLISAYPHSQFSSFPVNPWTSESCQYTTLYLGRPNLCLLLRHSPHQHNWGKHTSDSINIFSLACRRQLSKFLIAKATYFH